MRAKKLYAATDDLTNSRKHVAAMIILNAKAPVHYTTLVATEIVWTSAIPTAATDGVWVYVNPDFYRGLATDGQRAFLLGHEVSHIILRHPQRSLAYQKRGFFRHGMKFIHNIYNSAADYVINDDLIAMGLEPIPQGLYSDTYKRDDVVDTVYADIYKDQPEEPEGGEPEGEEGGFPSPESGEGEGEGEGDGDADEAQGGSDDTPAEGGSPAGNMSGEGDLPAPAGHDYHLTPEYEGDAEEQADAAAQDEYDISEAVDRGLDQMEAEGRDTSKVSDSLKDGGNRHRSDKQSNVAWNAELADRVMRVGKGERTSFSRIKVRQYATIGVISPETLGEFTRLTVISDISSSVRDEPFAAYLNELAAIQDAVNPIEGVTVLWTNHEVQRADEAYSSDELLNLDMPWKGGGTQMSAGLDWLDQNGVESDLIMVFTDGELYGDDWTRLAAQDDLLVVLDREPDLYIKRDLDRHNIDYIVAEAA
jgi:predicted metal-dependent peptidase